VFPSVGRIIAEYILSGGQHLDKRIIGISNAIIDAFNPLGGSGFIQTITPTFVDPIAALFENKDSFGRPISKEANPFKPTPGYERNRESASALSKGLSYALNFLSGGGKYGVGIISPTADQIDFLLGQYTGGVGREITKAVDLASAPFKEEGIPSYRVPIVGKLYGETKSDAAIQDKFYKNIIQMGEYGGTIKRIEQDKGDLSEFYMNHPEAKLYKKANEFENKINKFNLDRKELMRRNATKEQLQNNHNTKITTMRSFNEKVMERQ
jgi:hypothetical protein